MKHTKRMLLLEIGMKGVAKFAKLTEIGWEIVADKKSAESLIKLGVKYLSVEQVVGGNDIFSLNLLKDRILAGILASRESGTEMRLIYNKRIEKIDMVVISIPMSGNYDSEAFNSTIHALVLCSAQNAQGVTLVVDSADYEAVVEMIQKHGDTTPHMKMELVAKTYLRLASHFASLGRILDHKLRGHAKSFPL